MERMKRLDACLRSGLSLMCHCLNSRTRVSGVVSALIGAILHSLSIWTGRQDNLTEMSRPFLIWRKNVQHKLIITVSSIFESTKFHQLRRHSGCNRHFLTIHFIFPSANVIVLWFNYELDENMHVSTRCSEFCHYGCDCCFLWYRRC